MQFAPALRQMRVDFRIDENKPNGISLLVFADYHKYFFRASSPAFFGK